MEIKNVLTLSNVLINRHPTDKLAALEDLAHRATAALDLPCDRLLSALLKHEQLGSSAIGNGVALPHAHLPGVSKPSAA